MLRMPQSRFALENRAADMCMNPYLGLGMMLAASVDGVVNKIDPGKSVDEDLYVMEREGNLLAAWLGQTLALVG